MNARPKLLCFLLAALLVRLLVPAGYMIDTEGARGVRITLCAGDGVQAPLVSPMHGPMIGAMHNATHPQHHDHDRRAEGHSLCAYAALGNAYAPPPLNIALPPPPPPAPLNAPAHAKRAIRSALAAPPPPATGPPAARA